MSPGYDLLLVAHVVAGVVGFGAIGAAGYEARAGARAEDPARDLGLRRFFRPGVDWAGHVIFLVPVFGLSLLFGAERASLGDLWPWLGLGLWLVAAGLATGMCWPAERRAQQALSQLVVALPGVRPDPVLLSEFRSACRRMEASAGLVSIVFLVAVAVMIAKP